MYNISIFFHLHFVLYIQDDEEEHDSDTEKPRQMTLEEYDTTKANWVLLDNLNDAYDGNMHPQKLDGYLLKKRKWPMKGWHKVSMY